MPRGCWTACWGWVEPSGCPWYGPFTRPWQLFQNSIRAGRFTWKSGSGKLREAHGSILGLAETEWAYRRARPGQKPSSEALSEEPACPEVSGRTWAHLDSASQWASVIIYSHPLCALSTLHRHLTLSNPGPLETACILALQRIGVQRGAQVVKQCVGGVSQTTTPCRHLPADSHPYCLLTSQTLRLLPILPLTFRCHPQSHFLGKPCGCITLISFSTFTGFIWELGDCGSCTTS